MDKITEKKLKNYFRVAEEALEKAKNSKEAIKINTINKARGEFLDTVERYIEDAKYFKEKGKIVEAFAALNYVHGWFDAGVKLGIFDVKDSKLFAGVDDDNSN